MDVGNHSRNSSLSGSLVSQNSTRYVKNRRRNVGDRVSITSDSKVYLNSATDSVKSGSEIIQNEKSDCDLNKVSNNIRISKDLPKMKSRIFEDSIESQEISFYVGNNSDDDCTYEHITFDYSLETDSDSDYYQADEFQGVELRHDITETPLPPEPPINGFDKLTKNINKFKKNFSRDITKSLRRLSKKIYQSEQNGIDKNNDMPATKLTSIDPIKEPPKMEINETSKSDSFLTRIKRSVSLSAVSVTNLSNHFDCQTNQSQRRSTFYITDPIEFENEINTVKSSSNLTKSSVSLNSNKARIIRPKMPPPPVPPKNCVSENLTTDPDSKKQPNINTDRNSNSRTSWYTESGLYSKTLPIRTKTKKEDLDIPKRYSSKSSIYAESINNKVFSTVIQELNFKLNKTNNIEQSNNVINLDNESNYNQSVYSYSSSESKKDDSSVTYSKNDVTFLDDEPLYQFYDAGLFKPGYNEDERSDYESDIYEDMEEMNENYISSSIPDDSNQQDSITSQALTFTRSLWCEIPEVMKSTVLSTLSSQQKKLQEAKFEIITSEASYLNSLNVLLDYFQTKFKNSNIVNEKELEILFGKINDVRACSKKIFHDLEKCWQSNILLDGLCDLVQRHAEENFHVYIPYCENQIVISETLTKLRERADFAEFLNQLESSPTCQFLSLYSFLMLPMQRITRWPLLVDAILKRLSESDPEYLTCQYALATMNKTVNLCNEAARKKEQEIELQKISESLEFDKDVPLININTNGRVLLRSGSMVSYQPRNEDTRMTFGRRFSKITLHLFLFSDLFVVTKKKSDSAYTVIHYCPRNMIELRSIDMFPSLIKKDAQDKNLLYLSILENQNGKVVELLLSASTESDKERWIEAFTPPKSENPDETLYECWDCPQVTALHNYNSCQPDELSLSRGDVINVLRKMNDGWYHGERIRDGKTGWFPANYTSEIINPHVRARNLKQRYRLLTFSENYLKR